MGDLYYSTGSDTHLINIGEKAEDQWDELTEMELEEDIMDMWDLAGLSYEDGDRLYIHSDLLEDGE